MLPRFVMHVVGFAGSNKCERAVREAGTGTNSSKGRKVVAPQCNREGGFVDIGISCRGAELCGC
jgi:hypothetical protein